MRHEGYNELVNFIKQKNWQIFGTLTFKFAVSKEQAEKELNKFWNIIDRKLNGNLSWRKNIRTERLCFLQNGKINKNNHIHFVAKTIDGVNIKDFIIILEYFWKRKIKSSGKENVIKEVESLEAVSKYSMHEFYKLGNDTLALTSSNIKKTNWALLICLNKQETFFKNVALTIAMPTKNMMLVTEIYKTLKQGQLVSTLEEYSIHWLNKHKTTASYLIHKKRDLSLNAKINCLKNLKNKIIELENVNCFIKNLNNQNIIDLKQVINLIQNNIKLEFDLDIN